MTETQMDFRVGLDKFTSENTQNFVGRENDLRKLHTWLEQAIAGNGSFVIISGEAGIGKSSLAGYFALQASADRKISLISEDFSQTRFYEPYTPFVRIIGKLGASQLRKISGMVCTDQGENEPVINDIHSGPWNVEALYSLQTERGLAQQLLVSTILESSQKQPLLLHFFNVHKAPLTTWQFIHYLTHSIVDHPILILITLRQDGRESRNEFIPVYADILQRMNREGLIQKLMLNRFGKKEIREFFRKNLEKTDFSSRFLPLVEEVTDGLPARLHNMLRLMINSGILFQKNSVWFDRPDLSKEDLLLLLAQDNEESELPKVLTSMSIFHKTLLTYSALMEGYIDYHVLSSVLNVSPIKVVKEIKTLTDGKIFAFHDENHFKFRNSGIKTFLLEQIPQESRNELHLEIARAVEQSDELKSVQKIFLLAYHYSQTEEKHRAFHFLHQAGDHSLKNLAFSEAASYYHQASGILDNIPELLNESKTIEMLLEAAWLNRTLGNWDSSLKYCKLARKSKFYRIDESIRVQVMLQEAFTQYRRNDWDHARLKFEECLSNDVGKKDFNLALINYGLGSIYFEISDYASAEKYYQAALEIARQVNAKSILGHILNNLGALKNVQGKRLQAVALYSKSIPIFKELGDQNGIARIYHNIGMTHADDGHWSQANEFYGKSLRVSDEMGLVPLKSITFLNRALALANLKQFEEAREYNFKAFRLLNQLRDELGIAEYYKIQGIIELEENELEKAERFLNIALKKFSHLKNKLGCAETEYEHSRLARKRKNPEKTNEWQYRAYTSYSELGLTEKIKMLEKELQLPAAV